MADKYNVVSEANLVARKLMRSRANDNNQGPMQASLAIDDIHGQLTTLMNRARTEFKMTVYDSILIEASVHIDRAREKLRQYERLAIKK